MRNSENGVRLGRRPVRLELSLIRVQAFKTFARGAAPD
jgi:hypothetical protein